VDCADILDLTDPVTRSFLGIAGADLGCAWEDMADRGRRPPTWTLAERLVALGHPGILAPSFASGATRDDVNAVFWRRSVCPPHQVRVIDDYGRRPNDDRSSK
jgi:RES domain-containing protein